MVRHLIMWDYKDGLTDVEKTAGIAEMRKRLEALVGVVPGLISMKIISDTLSNSNRPILLNSLFENEAALLGYLPHPAHVACADFVRTITQNRSCVDYEE